MPENIQGRKFNPVGVCIYCGSLGDEGGLRSEHFLPESLGGKAELLGASCKRCEAETSYLDGYLARRTYYDFRMHAGIKGKHRKRAHPATLPTELTFRGEEKTLDMAVEHRPYFTILPALPPPGLLRGADPEEPLLAGQAYAYHYIPADLRVRLDLSNDEDLKIRARGDINVSAFARGIAKIGYGAAVSHLGHDAFDPLEIREVILGASPCIGYYVGGREEAEPPEPDPHGRMHWINIEEVEIGSETLIVATIRLFADGGTEEVGMPIYEVVVGRKH